MRTHCAVHFRRWGVISTTLGVLLLVAAPSLSAGAEDLSGVWLVNANGYTFRLELTQAGSAIRGTLFGLNNANPPTRIQGAAKDGIVRFTRIGEVDEPFQQYRGQVVLASGGRWMKGTFEYDGTSGYGWCAVDARIAAPPDQQQWQDCALPADADDFELRFLGFEDGQYVALDDLAYEKPFFVEVRFARDQEAPSYDIELRWNETGTDTVRVRRSLEDPTVYRSEEIVIAAPDPETGVEP